MLGSKKLSLSTQMFHISRETYVKIPLLFGKTKSLSIAKYQEEVEIALKLKCGLTLY